MKKNLFFLLLGPLLFFSCVEDQNFNQVDDLSILPAVATSLIFFESPEDVINERTAGVFYVQTFTFEAFNETFVSERLVDGVITYQLENTTSKDLRLSIEFIDAEGNVLDAETFSIQSQPSPLVERQVAYGNGDRSLDILRNTVTIRVTSENLGDNTSESNLNEPSIILRSSAAFRVRLQ